MEPNLRRAICRPDGAQDWEARKAQIVELYDGMSLNGLMKLMEEEHLFKATKKQYKTQLGKWKLRKNTTAADYKAMIRKKRKRQRFGKARSAFRLRGAEVKDSNIIRFQKRKRIQDDDEMSDVATPSSLSCYTPTRDARSRSPSLAQSIVPSSTNQALDNSICCNTSSSIISPGKRKPHGFPSEWYPAFDECVNLSAVGVPTYNYNFLFFNCLESLVRPLISALANFMDPFSHLNCDKVDCTIVKDLQVGHALAIQQRKELLALIHGAPIDVSKAVFGTSSNAEVESMVNSLLGAVESCQTAYKGFLLSRSQAHRRSCKPVRSSQENSTKKPVCALLLHGNITFHTNQFQDDIPCFAGRSAQRSNVREVLEYSGPNDPTLTEAATWNELMEIC